MASTPAAHRNEVEGRLLVERWGSATDRGRVRSLNEDSLVAGPPVFVVADGMGGHAAGDVASALAVHEFESLVGATEMTATHALDAIDSANEAILRAAASDVHNAGMGTTITGLVEVKAGGAEHWMVFNVGDCRVYRLEAEQLRQLTTDHSEVQELVDAGKLSPAQARQHRRRNVVTRSLGFEPNPVADSWVFPPGDHDRFILCSDGLTTEVADDEIQEAASTLDDPQLVADELIRRAISAGGRDNVTVIVVDGRSRNGKSDADGDTVPRGTEPVR